VSDRAVFVLNDPRFVRDGVVMMYYSSGLLGRAVYIPPIVPLQPVTPSAVHTVVTVAIVCLVLTWLTVFLRFWNRFVIMRFWGYDDVFMGFSIVSLSSRTLTTMLTIETIFFTIFCLVVIVLAIQLNSRSSVSAELMSDLTGVSIYLYYDTRSKADRCYSRWKRAM
jgi:hypothetical protein